jgi:hypothetical protein
MENKTLDALFGPLNKKYCLWFYFLSVFGFVFLIIASKFSGNYDALGAFIEQIRIYLAR